MIEFYPTQHEVIKSAVAEAQRAHVRATGTYRDQLTAVTRELRDATTAIDRYLTAFERGTLDDEDEPAQGTGWPSSRSRPAACGLVRRSLSSRSSSRRPRQVRPTLPRSATTSAKCVFAAQGPIVMVKTVRTRPTVPIRVPSSASRGDQGCLDAAGCSLTMRRHIEVLRTMTRLSKVD